MRTETVYTGYSIFVGPERKVGKEHLSTGYVDELEKPEKKIDHWTDCLLRVRDAQDKAAFAELFQHFAPRIKSYLIKSGGSASQAEEAAQEAMATVWHKAHLFKPECASATTWIFTIARNKQLDAFRKIKRPDPEEPYWETPAEQDPAQAVEIAQEEKNIREAVKCLPERQREIIEKAFFGELTHSEISKETGLPLGTIKSRIRLGLDRLRHEMKLNDA